ncbi:MAG TPA: glycoside hydrolase family 43 protein, partial [Arachnia sp.]|nr:glycoside hydrolase family 43 protein [Arachnia sp.]
MPATHANTLPVIPGFWSDPTVCRAGDEFVLVNSSFEYFPGAPVHRSADMVSWEHIGHVITRPDQADLASGMASTGIYGSTVRHHDGRFWFITTNLMQAGQGQLLFTAEDPAGPWSDPVLLPGLVGIDPDICWDDEGRCHVTWCAFPNGISRVEVDPTTGAILSEPVPLWMGTGGRNPEGPHLYRVGDWWYLLIAEGGTHIGHMVTIARSRDIDGPYEASPANPILTHRSTDHPVQGVGHADLVEGPDGQWWAVFHGIRPRGTNPHFHLIGRETFVARVEWVDEWPVIVEEDLHPVVEASVVDEFVGVLDVRWVVPGGSLDGIRPTTDGLELTATAGPGLPVLTRVRHLGWSATIELDVSRGDASVQLRVDDRHSYALEVTSERVRA